MSTKIQWCDEVWNPTVGCTRVSAGCDNCYAIGVAARGMAPQHRGLTKIRPKSAKRPGPDWTGEVRTVPSKLSDPLHWRKPRRVFVNSMSDLFHHAVAFEYIAAVFGVMAACPQHTFLVLTKRPERALAFFAWVDKRARDGLAMFPDDPPEWRIGQMLSVTARRAGVNVANANRSWPIPNVHLGVSVEDQDTADERIPVLLECPAAVHWISAEPLLDMVVLRNWTPERARMGYVSAEYERLTGIATGDEVLLKRGPHIGWVVVGGESGRGARRFDVGWARSLVKRCAEDGVAVFVKQLGANPEELDYPGGYLPLRLADRKGGDMSEWPRDLRVREVPR